MSLQLAEIYVLPFFIGTASSLVMHLVAGHYED